MPLTAPQKSISDDSARFKVVVAGRRFGKSYLSLNEMAKHARHPNKNIYYIAPTWRQSKNIIWDDLKERLGKVRWIKKVNESDLTVTLVNNSKISLRSAENFDSMRGVSLDFAVLDECAFMKKEVFTEVIRPALSDRQGHAMMITTPKGRNWVYDLWSNAKHQKDWSAFQFTTLDGGNVLPEEVEAAKADMDEKTFRAEYLATFETYAGIIYYNFDPAENLRVNHAAPDRREILHIGCDFNVSPICATVGTWREGHLHIHDEIQIYGSNTYELAEEIKRRYPEHRVWVYPDASGQANKTNSVKSDHNILREFGFIIKANRSNPPVIDRIASVNSGFKTANGETRLTIDPGCKNMIKCLTHQTYKEGTRIPDKDTGYDHMNDALGYVVHGLMPIKRPTVNTHGPKTFSHF